MPEVRDAANEGRLLEVFGAGTAAVICPATRPSGIETPGPSRRECRQSHPTKITVLVSFERGRAPQVNEIFYEGASVNVPTGAGAGPVASSLWKKLSDIQYGRTASDWAVAV